jgi:hypothetical protein
MKDVKNPEKRGVKRGTVKELGNTKQRQTEVGLFEELRKFCGVGEKG